MITNFPHLAQRMLHTPLLLHPSKAEIIMGALSNRLGITGGVHRVSDDDDGGLVIPVHDMTPGAMSGQGGNPRGGYDVECGVALVPVSGTLVQRLGTMRPYSGMTGYDTIRANVALALDDPDVDGILLDIDSPGGEAAGCFDLADFIYECRGTKPIWALANEMAFSGGYAIASACDRIITTRTGGTGSVGVIVMHMDWSDAVDAAGLKVTIITFGDKKADGNQFERLSKGVQSRIQSDIDTIGELFVETVARNRGISPDDVRNTQAGCFMGSAGVEVGFVDEILSAEAAFSLFVESL